MSFSSDSGFIPKNYEDLQENIRINWNQQTGSNLNDTQFFGSNVFIAGDVCSTTPYMQVQKEILKTINKFFMEISSAEEDFSFNGAIYDSLIRALNNIGAGCFIKAKETGFSTMFAGEIIVYFDYGQEITNEPELLDTIRDIYKHNLAQATTTNQEGGLIISDPNLKNVSFTLLNGQVIEAYIVIITPLDYTPIQLEVNYKYKPEAVRITTEDKLKSDILKKWNLKIGETFYREKLLSELDYDDISYIEIFHKETGDLTYSNAFSRTPEPNTKYTIEPLNITFVEGALL